MDLPETVDASDSWQNSVRKLIGSDKVTVHHWRIEPTQAGPLAHTRRSMSAHTDGTHLPRPPDYVALGCISPPSFGGATFLLDGHDLIPKLRVGMAAALREPRWYWRLPGADRTRLAAPRAVLAEFGRIRWWRFALWPVDGVQESVADELDTILIQQQPSVKVEWTSQCALLFDNARMLHGREAFDGSRVLRRAHLWVN
ncbi:TauD/TfdA family dioxygenase [Nocardia sp. NPDC060259]|uniref:TauD/TfdA family dioxygenase n=1 Tax=Nocardia sp. NPDC060259 TaxID=3347088 RepID=UPI0036573F0D